MLVTHVIPMAISLNSVSRLRKHADYQRVYKQGRKQFSQQISYFYALRPEERTPSPFAFQGTGPRVGLTVGKVLGKAVDRNRIKRRMREAVRAHLAKLTGPVDVILHPRKSVKDIEYQKLEREVARIFAAVQAATHAPIYVPTHAPTQAPIDAAFQTNVNSGIQPAAQPGLHVGPMRSTRGKPASSTNGKPSTPKPATSKPSSAKKAAQ